MGDRFQDRWVDSGAAVDANESSRFRKRQPQNIPPQWWDDKWAETGAYLAPGMTNSSESNAFDG
jgi:hypothetical protein